MEELKVLIEAIAELPDLAIWVIGMYFFFKIAVVGSIYGVIRFAIGKLHSYGMKKKEPDTIIKQSNITLEGKVIASFRAEPEAIYRLFEKLKNGKTYIFESDVEEVLQILNKNLERN